MIYVFLEPAPSPLHTRGYVRSRIRQHAAMMTDSCLRELNSHVRARSNSIVALPWCLTAARGKW